MAQENTAVAEKDPFEAAFAEAAVAAEKEVQAAETPPADDAAAKKAEEDAAEAKKAEDDKRAEEDAAAAKKAEEDAAAAKKAAETPADGKTETPADTRTPEEIAAAKKAEDDAAAAKKTAEDKQAEEDARAARAAEEKTRKDAEAAAALKQAEDNKKAEAELAEALKDYQLSEEETKALEAFKKDFPTEHVAIEARFKSLDRIVNQRVHQAVQAVLGYVYKDLAPVVQGFSSRAEEEHYAAIHKAHEDYDTVIEQVPAWIKKQPAYLQTVYQQVYDEGTAQEVIDMVARFKESTGAKPAASATSGTPAPATPAPKPGPTAEDIASGLPVNAKRSTPNQKGAPSKEDFDGAFEEAAAAK